MDSSPFKTREQVLDAFDAYAQQRRDEIDSHQLTAGKGLIKSYLLETRPQVQDRPPDLVGLFGYVGWELEPIEGGAIFAVRESDGFLGYLEPFSPRHLLLHSTAETSRADRVVGDAVFGSAQLDFAWLAGSYFQTIWELVILPQMPHRLVAFKFQHLATFEGSSWSGRGDETDDDSPFESGEHRSSSLAITERAEEIARFLPALQDAHAPFRAIRMLRFPAVHARGGYDFWTRGKVTYRSPDFRQGRIQVRSITGMYEKTTHIIEERLWVQAEKTTLRDGEEAFTLTGAPVTLEFNPPLSRQTFDNLIKTTFDKGQGPLRLMGNPIRLGEEKVHVYGVDLHLWQRLYLEITPRRMLVVLPKGTCGNTVHRLVANVQRYLSPTVEAFIGDLPYKELVRGVFLGETPAKGDRRG